MLNKTAQRKFRAADDDASYFDEDDDEGVIKPTMVTGAALAPARPLPAPADSGEDVTAPMEDLNGCNR